MSAGADFEKFAASAWPRLYRSMFAVARDAHDAEDAVQSAMVDAQRHWGRVQSAGDPLAYVRRIALNALLAERRRPRWRREVPDAGTHGERHTSPVDMADATTTRLIMIDAIRALPPRQRAIVVCAITRT